MSVGFQIVQLSTNIPRAFAADYDITTNTTWCDQADIPASIGTLTVENNATLTIGCQGSGSFDTTGLTITAGTIQVGGGNPGTIQIVSEYTSETNGVGVKLNAGNLTVASGSTITGDASGYAGTHGPGAGVSPGTNNYGYEGTGGGYGGTGGGNATGDSGGVTYGSSIIPIAPGSGGGNGPSGGTGGAGGAAIDLEVTNTLTLGGTITSNGGTGGDGACCGAAAGGGSGGSILVHTALLTGSGTLNATGGNGGSNNQGGSSGGGGRIAVYYTDTTTNSSYTAFATDTAHAGSAAHGVAGGISGLVGTIGFFDQSITSSHLSVYENFAFSADTTATYGAVTIEDAGNLDIGGNSTLTISGSFTVTGSSTVTVFGKNTTTNSGGLGATIYADSMNVASGSSISADGHGYTSAHGPGAGSNVGTGGGHGGTGGTNSTGASSGTSYDDSVSPTDFGSGGATGSTDATGGAGGGSIALTVTNTLTLGGTVSAKGVTGTDGTCCGTAGGGGAGGSILVHTGTLTGAGTFTAAGGGGGTNNNGGAGGGGGRIAIYYSDRNSANDFTGFAGSTTIGGTHNCCGSPASTDGGNGTIGFFDTSRGTNNYSLTVWQHFSFNQNSTITYGEIKTKNGGSLTIGGGSTVQVSDFRIIQNSSVTLQSKNTSADSGGVGVTMNLTGLTIDSGSTLTTSSQGYQSAHGPGAGTISGGFGSGAGHGGGGGNAGSDPAVGGGTYDDAEQPTDLGSGGGNPTTQNGANGGLGGGALTLTATTLTNNGTITADGGTDAGWDGGGFGGCFNGNGGGSGGSIYALVNTVTGAGSFTAKGGHGGAGNCANNNGGGGGGGRIGIYYITRSSDTTTLSCSGGTADSGGLAGADGTCRYAARPTTSLTSPTNTTIVNVRPNLSLVGNNFDTTQLTGKIDYVTNGSSDCSTQTFSGATTVESTSPTGWNNNGLYSNHAAEIYTPPTALADGWYCWRAATRATSGDYTDYGPYSATSAFRVDGTAPVTASVTSFTNGAFYRAATTPSTISGSAADNSAGAGLVENSTTYTVQRVSDSTYWNGASFNATQSDLSTTHTATTDGATTNWTKTSTLPTWNDGQYRLQATATDRAANSASGTAVIITYDNTPPTSPSNVNVGSTNTTGTGQQWTDSTSELTASWTAATDATSGVANYQVSVGSTSGGTDMHDWSDAGNGTTVTVSGLSLSSGSSYYVSVRAIDAAGNIGPSAISDPVVIDTAPPAAVTDLSATANENGTINLNWTAPGDDSNSGTATSYTVRYLSTPITTANFETATNVNVLPIPSVAGSHESLNITGLSTNTKYFFALTATDDVGRTSELSNVAQATTLNSTQTPPLTTSTSGAPTVVVTSFGISQTAANTAIYLAPNTNATVAITPSTAKSVTSITLSFANGSVTTTSADSNNTYHGSIATPATAGSYVLTATVTYTDNTTDEQVTPITIEAYGRVFTQTLTSQSPIANAIATLYETDGSTPWNAQSFNQANPQQTDASGSFYFFVPAGSYVLNIDLPSAPQFYHEPFVVTQPRVVSVGVDGTRLLMTAPATTALIEQLLGSQGARVVFAIQAALAPIIATPAVQGTKQVTDVVTAGLLTASVLAPLVANLALLDPLGQLLASLLGLIGARRQRHRSWGKVTDAESGQPIALALVRLLTVAEGKVVDSQLTDQNGQFGFFASPGTYTVQVQKNHYQFPSKLAINGYRGTPISVTGSNVVNVDIALDPELSTVSSRMRIIQRIGQWSTSLRIPILVAGTILAVVFAVGSFALLHLAVLGLYTVAWLYIAVQHRTFHPSPSEVLDATNNTGLDLAIVRLFNDYTGKLVASHVTDQHGRAFLLIGPGRYHTTVTRQAYQRYTSEGWSETHDRTSLHRRFSLTKISSTATTPSLTPVANEPIPQAPESAAPSHVETEPNGVRIEYGPSS